MSDGWREQVREVLDGGPMPALIPFVEAVVEDVADSCWLDDEGRVQVAIETLQLVGVAGLREGRDLVDAFRRTHWVIPIQFREMATCVGFERARLTTFATVSAFRSAFAAISSPTASAISRRNARARVRCSSLPSGRGARAGRCPRP